MGSNGNNRKLLSPEREDLILAALGDGVMDLPAVVRKARESGAKYFFVEQDNAADLPDGFEQVARSAAYARKEL